MKESDDLLNPIISSSINIDGSENLLINNNKNDNDNINNYFPNKSINIQNNQNKELVRSSNVINITIRGKILQRVENDTILFYKRRKFPKEISQLKGYISTLLFFIVFSILFTIVSFKAKDIKAIENSNNNFYNYIILFMWIFSILSMISLTDAASADPGRQRGTPIIKSKFDSGKIRKIVGGKKYFLKYCSTCNLIRDIRTFHCNKCNLCVEKHDHHCGYISNCVGVYNYKKFFTFIVLAFIHVSIIFYTCIYFLVKYGGELQPEEEYLLFAFIFILLFGGFFEFFVFGMIAQHIQIIVINRTTREFIKHKQYKVYDKGCKRNCNEAFCQSYVKEI